MRLFNNFNVNTYHDFKGWSTLLIFYTTIMINKLYFACIVPNEFTLKMHAYFLQFKQGIFAVLRMHKKEIYDTYMCISFHDLLSMYFYVARSVLAIIFILHLKTFKKSINIT